MFQKLHEIKENLVLYSVACHGIGFICLYFYYYIFSVPIIYYLSFNDILLYSLTILTPAVIVSIILEFCLFNWLKLNIDILFTKLNKNKIGDESFYFILLIVISIVLFALTKYCDISIDPKIMLLVMFTYLRILYRFGRGVAKIQYTFFLLFIGLILSIYILTLYTRLGISNIIVQFEYGDKYIASNFNRNICYIGETSSRIFLYDTKKEVSYVYEKDKISNLSYRNQILNESNLHPTFKIPDQKTIFIKKKGEENKYYNKWFTYDKKNYEWKTDTTSIDIATTIDELNKVLEQNNFILDFPNEDYSSLPLNLKLEDDYKLLNSAILSGNYKVEKFWSNYSGMIYLRFDKSEYKLVLIKY